MVDEATKNPPALQFNPDIAASCSDTCPPSEAAPVHQTVFRGIREPPVTANDFLSHAELEADGADPSSCEHWGLSVWVSEAAVAHARDVYRPLRKWHVASAELTPADGVILATPSAKQPDHHTLWKPLGRDLSTAFTIVMLPSNS